ncbi:MAG TPA: bifunctional diguanylate cyclase/phosphodiesterase [Solirubrobacteraceae bacterium]|nr:bifunctional diguanylate cyclase/phosphodiesterase [Solirubrobacteraceae bacterium]
MDGSLLDAETWRARHRFALLWSGGLTLFIAVFSLFNPNRPEQWAYVAAALLTLSLAQVRAWSRRLRAVLVAVCFMAAQLYVARFVGNFTLGPLAMIVLTFYQDWVPLAVGCLETLAVIVVAWVDPGFFSHSAAFAREDPLTGMALRGAAILLAAFLSLAIWRSGTQLARDQLTGMLSRLGVERVLDREIARGRRPAVWVCDVDNFAAVNRQLGARTGDAVLRHVASGLRRTAAHLPGGALTARLGGDTFLIAERDGGEIDAVEAFAHRIEIHGAKLLAGSEVQVRLSVGAALAAPAEPAAHLIRVAERNMRAAKGRGSVRVVVDRSSDRIVDASSSLLSSELYAACERGELDLHVQPIVALADGTPVGGETLARWTHPQRGMVYPGDFLPEAEQDSALMAVISNTLGNTFHDIVADFARRYGPGWLPYGLSYNLAAVRLRDPTLTATLVTDFERTGLKGTAARVNVEVTEGALMDIEHGVAEALASFRDAGYCLALDDFGIGHSSLAHLRDFPLDTVKLDKSFVQSMGRSRIDRAVVEAVAEIASVSGLTVIAEGVETVEQRDMLLSIKPDMLAQGWLYAKAMPVAEFEAWVVDHKRAAVA